MTLQESAPPSACPAVFLGPRLRGDDSRKGERHFASPTPLPPLSRKRERERRLTARSAELHRSGEQIAALSTQPFSPRFRGRSSRVASAPPAHDRARPCYEGPMAAPYQHIITLSPGKRGG